MVAYVDVASFTWRFQWDPVKAAANLANHSVSFEQAASVFLDPLALTIFDDEHTDVEERWVTLGRSASGTPLAVVHTIIFTGANSANVRIISARRPTRAEMRDYEEGEYEG